MTDKMLVPKGICIRISLIPSPSPNLFFGLCSVERSTPFSSFFHFPLLCQPRNNKWGGSLGKRLCMGVYGFDDISENPLYSVKSH